LKRAIALFEKAVSFLGNKYALFFFRIILGCTFITSALTKLPDQAGFTQTVLGYGLLSGTPAQLFALVLPWAELATGFLLIFGFFIRLAGVTGVLMVTSFLTANVFLMVHGGSPSDSCGCFGEAVPLSNTGSLIAYIAMLVMLLPLVLNKARQASFRQVFSSFRLRYAVNIALAAMLLIPSAASASAAAGTETPFQADLLELTSNPTKTFIDTALAEGKKAVVYF